MVTRLKIIETRKEMSEISNFFPLTKSGPSAIVDAAHIGFSDEKLEALCRKPSHFELGFAPWASWEAENSSFGKTFRNWARFPSFLPLFISSDHGVHWESRCWDNETLNEFKTYFTWNQKKNANMRSVFQKNSYHVPHPWVNYRKKYFPTLPLNRT